MRNDSIIPSMNGVFPRFFRVFPAIQRMGEDFWRESTLALSRRGSGARGRVSRRFD
jgi:hypothetical protein